MKPTGKRIKSFLLRFSLLPLLLLGVGGYAPIVLAQSAGTFIPTGNMITHRHSHSATLLQNGKVLITGGWSNSTLLASAELFDPDTGTFSATGNMTTPHFNHSATLLPDGRVLIAGGRVLDDGHPLDHPPAAAELYDPSTGTFTPTGRMVRPQAGNTSTLLNNGKVLISGTCQDWFYTDADAEGDRPELYDPVTGTFNAAGQDGRSPRWCSGPVVLLANGKVLVATGELYDPATDTFSSTGPRKMIGFWGATATLLTNGKVLVAGGTSDLGDSTKGELYDLSLIHI